MLHLILGVTNPFPGQDDKLRPGLDPDQVTPGALGFFSTLFMVLAVVLLMRSMVKRVRRVRYRALAEQQRSQPREGDETRASEKSSEHEVGTDPGNRNGLA